VSVAAPATLHDYLRRRQQAVDARLDQLLPAATQYPQSVHRAMRHSLFAGGKRIRPILCLEAAEVVLQSRGPEGADPNRQEYLPCVLDVACALEMIHTYSLIHDDLPALDNDDFRRGQPTCHKAFGEAIAILAGDALLTLAFHVLARNGPGDLGRRAAILAEVARAAGTLEGMIGGQVIDLESEGRPADAATVEYIHRAKTGAMIRAAVRSGALAAGASEQELAALAEYGAHVGLAFQIVDDLLDVESSSAKLGKTAGKDAAQHKITFPAVYGREASHRMAEEELAKARLAVDMFGDRAGRLRELADLIVHRRA